MNRTALAIAAVAAVLSFSGAAVAANSSATLTADNEFSFYVGNSTGSNLSAQIGTGADWQQPFTYSFDMAAGDYLYVLVHNTGGPNGWQGVFNTPDGTVLTNNTQWQWVTTDNLTLVSGDIPASGWSVPLVNNSASWGDVVGNSGAQWIWNCNCSPTTDYYLFRTATPLQSAAVPEPETYALMAAGLGVLGFLGKRRRKTA